MAINELSNGHILKMRPLAPKNTRLTRALNDAEAELNDRVYRLFNLTPDEIKLLQKEVEH